MAPKIVLTGASGKIGGAVLNAILEYELVPPSDLVIATSSKPDHPKLARAVAAGVTIRESNYESVDLMTKAFAGCERLFLVSTPHIDLDFYDSAKGGREKHHFRALEAAKRAGISHVYYTSLAFQDPSKAGVMSAHLETEKYLRSQKDFQYTILREGIYNESWPLYLGHYDLKNDDRDSIIIGPDGPISWTAIPDLGLANALIFTGDERKWNGQTLWLSAKQTLTIFEVLGLVQKELGKTTKLEVRTQEEYIKYYIDEMGMDTGMIRWWSSTYPALEDGECKIDDSPLEDLLATKHRRPLAMAHTVREMMSTRGRR